MTEGIHDGAEIVGLFVWTVLLSIGIIEAIFRTLKPHTNRYCMVAIIATYASLMVTVQAACGLEHFPQAAVAFKCVLMAAVIVLVAASTLAVVGLVENARHRGAYKRGKGRAIFSLILSLPLLGFLCFLFATQPTEPGPRPAITAESPMPRDPEPAHTPEAHSMDPFVSEDFNFKLIPPPGWFNYDAKTSNPSVAVGIRRTFPMVFCNVIAERLGVESSLTLDSFEKIAKSNITSLATSATFDNEQRINKDGLDIAQFDSNVEMNHTQFFYSYRLLIHNGYQYQILIWGKQEDKEKVLAEAGKVTEGFRILHSGLVAHATGARGNARFDSKKFGYSVDLTGTPWNKQWVNLDEDSPSAEFGIMRQRTGVFAMMPLALGSEDVDIDILKRSFLARLGMQYPDSVRDEKTLTRDGVEMTGMTADRQTNNLDLRYHFRILKHDGFAYMAVAWYDKKKEEHDDFLDDALDKITYLHAEQPDATTYTKRERIAQGLLSNEVGLSFYKDKQYEKSITWFKKAIQANDQDPVFFTNAENAYDRLNKPREALELFRQHPDAVKASQDLQASQAGLKSECDDTEGALKDYAGLFAAGFRDETHLNDYVQLLVKNKQPDKAIDELEKFTATKDSVSVRVIEASVYRNLRQYDKAIALMQKQVEANPDDADAGYALVESYYGAQKYDEGIQQCEKMIAAGTNTAYVNFLKGRCEYELKWYAQAKKSFETAHQKTPTDQDVKDWLNYASAMLGEGSNEGLKNEIQPVSIPADLLGAPAGKPAEKYLTGYDAYFLRSVTAIAFEKKKELKTTEYRLVKIVNTQGASDFNSFEFPVDPVSEEIFVNSLVVRDAAGKVVSTGKVSDYYLADDNSKGEASQRKNLHIPVAGLQPDYTVELMFTRRKLGSASEFDFVQHLFSKGVPVVSSALIVKADTKMLKWQASPGLVEKKTGDSVSWQADSPPAFHLEPFQQPADTYLPTVCVGDASVSWESEVKDYVASVHDRFQMDDALKAASAAQVAGLKTAREKAEALARFVQKNFSYKAIEFGRRARIPQTADTTLQNKYGDCKDLALLLHDMLEAAGIPSYLALVNPDKTVQKEVASMDQFNHMIVFAPELDGGRFFDCTDKDTGANMPVPYGLSGKDVLIIDESKPRFVRIPDYPADSSVVESKREIQITGESDAKVNETLTCTGYSAASMRSSLRRVNAGDRKSYVQQELVSGGATMQVEDFSVDNLDDTAAPLVLRLKYSVKQSFQVVEHRLVGQIPAPWERLYLSTDPVQERQSPFRIWFPLKFSSSVVVSVPQGYELTAAAPAPAEIKPEFGKCKIAETNSPQELRLNYEFFQEPGAFPASSYEDYQENMTRALSAAAQKVVFKKMTK